ncbi:ThiF family adenylyltransferase [Ureibacillus chungkukjangi]|uniref:ThiF family adenylyltransferase n=1 Tax=Ureibacillus chungkukjangi TaxID=1202712 RepID=UPI00203ABBED|nr:ThiF family adenylyltransferase [Ureibacillus chungkukjangi]
MEEWDNNYSHEFYSKQLYYFEQFNENPNLLQERLCNARVAIIGLGGVGGLILQNLTASGISNFVLIDYDQVEIDNLNRQYIYSKESIGYNKIDVAQSYINSINSEAKIITYKKLINSSRDLSEIFYDNKIDIIINAADTPIYIGNIILDFCKKNNIPFLSGKVGISKGTWGPLFNKEIYDQDFSIIDETTLNKYIKRNPIKGSLGATNSILSSFMSYDILLFLMGIIPKSLGNKCIVDFNNLSITTESIGKNISV